MKNYVLDRYRKETGNMVPTFYKAEKQQEFAKWMKNTLLLSTLFFKKLVEDYVQDACYFYELASSKETSVSSYLPQIPSFIEIEPFCRLDEMLPSFNQEKCENPKTGCLLVQGIYPSLAVSLQEFAKDGMFAIGVVGRKHTTCFQKEVKYYHQIYQQLLYNGVPLNPPIQASNQHFKSYILTKKV